MSDKIDCRYVEDVGMVAVEVKTPDGTTRSLALPPTKWGRDLAWKIVNFLESENEK